MIIGPVHDGNWQKDGNYLEFCRLSNTYFLGGKHQKKIPDYLSSFDVGILPYRIYDSWAQYCSSPLKLYEYLNSGLPVVSTPLPYDHDVLELINIPYDINDWIKVIQEVIEEQSNELKEKRIEYSLRNTWKSRVDEIHRIILSFLN